MPKVDSDKPSSDSDGVDVPCTPASVAGVRRIDARCVRATKGGIHDQGDKRHRHRHLQPALSVPCRDPDDAGARAGGADRERSPSAGEREAEGGTGPLPGGTVAAALAPPHSPRARPPTSGTELQVDQVVLRIHPAGEPHHGATANSIDLVQLAGEREVRRERWSLSRRLEFLGQVPSELVVYNVTGVIITYL